MLDQVKIGNILFLDIETVPVFPSFDQAPERFKELWEKKATHLCKENETAASLYPRAGIYSEFGKIVCISTGMIGLKDDQRALRLKSYYAEEEKVLLDEFADMVTRLCQKREIDLCAHNGKEFDFPYISRRLLINNLRLPPIFDLAGKRPWEVRHLDTLELWKFGDHKHYTSLDLLSWAFNLESPKSDIEGSQVAEVFYNQHDLNRIVEYCRRDVVAVAQLMLKYKGEPALTPEEIISLDHT